MSEYPPPPNTDWIGLWSGDGGVRHASRKRTRYGESVVGLCPAHDDHNPSLQLWVDQDGWPQCKCYAGCDRVTVMESLTPHLWPDNHPALLALRKGTYRPTPRPAPQSARGPSRYKKDARKEFAELSLKAPPPPDRYPYALKGLHEDIVSAEPSGYGPWTYHAMPEGEPALRVYRFDLVNHDGEMDKTFRQATPRREHGKVRWTGSGLSYDDIERGLRVYPYGYERIAQFEQMPLIWVEGEKSADALRQLAPDLIALSLIGSRPEAHDFEALLARQSRYHVIWPDPDEPGDQKAEWLYRQIANVPGQHLAMLPPTSLGLRETEDAWDWCRKQNRKPSGTARELLLSVLRHLRFLPTPVRYRITVEANDGHRVRHSCLQGDDVPGLIRSHGTPEYTCIEVVDLEGGLCVARWDRDPDTDDNAWQRVDPQAPKNKPVREPRQASKGSQNPAQSRRQAVPATNH
ncbi:hypothetical protein BJI67_15720 (plasmid) [Acidihalobacter aeolianus]|uniref:Toprim domain-containing protein n=1 Tax=Acidihalobacter aeolianus TaxID=2792603 RepID=A0A1D8KCK6_9GAMM|nr:toprim domain-containing protein [Acidihalobacter aeolianus]AOV18694.1 hypothetical protein BJI67_15720 [Acidihalobacter aeolianus]